LINTFLPNLTLFPKSHINGVNIEYNYIRNQMIKNVVTSNVGLIDNTSSRSFQLAFAVNTTLLFYSEWIRGNKKMPIDNIIDLTYKTIKYGISAK